MPNIKKVVVANTRFGFKLFAEVAKQDAGKNVFISPSSIAFALAVTYNGASGETRRAMTETLELHGMSLDEVNRANAKLREMLTSLDPQVKLAIANSLWLKHGETFKPEFVQRGRDFYDAEVSNFGNQDAPVINGWVSNKTLGKITKLVTDSDVSSAILMLINAIYFKGNWTAPFDRAQTREGDFTLLDGRRKKLPMMSKSGGYRLQDGVFKATSYPYYQGKGFQAVSLPYGSERVSMYIFLPDKESSLAGFQKQLTAKNWDDWMSRFHTTRGSIVLPRFKLDYEIKLNETLESLGMGVAFGPRAEFGEMTPPPAFISKVIHKTFVEVNEEGAEAAATTAVMVLGGPPVESFTMIIDRPFFCAIRDNETGTLLFMGSIVDPQ
jgi:serpin B